MPSCDVVVIQGAAVFTAAAGQPERANLGQIFVEFRKAQTISDLLIKCGPLLAFQSCCSMLNSETTM